jgi:hypothetical protein
MARTRSWMVGKGDSGVSPANDNVGQGEVKLAIA